MSEAPKKKVVKVESKSSTRSAATPKDGAAPAAAASTANAPVWVPTSEAKAKSTKLRWFAVAAWVVAIAVEAFAIFWVLRQTPVQMWLLIVLIVVTGVLSVVGSLLWKQANRLDPASKQDKVRFFAQNQLGAIIAVIAFLPLIILIFTNKNMDGKQKAIAGSIGVVALLIATAFGVSWDAPSQEQYAEETNIIQQLTGEDTVFWVKGGSVFHVCEAVPDVNRESQDGQIYSGTVAAAHEAGKDSLTKRWQSEAVNYCGYSAEQVAAVEAGLTATTDADEPADDADLDAPATDETEPTE